MTNLEKMRALVGQRVKVGGNETECVGILRESAMNSALGPTFEVCVEGVDGSYAKVFITGYAYIVQCDHIDVESKSIEFHW